MWKINIRLLTYCFNSVILMT